MNDWVAIDLNIENSPEITMEELYTNGIRPENTVLKDSEYYKEIPRVKEKFTKDGKFDEDSYNEAYKSWERSFNEFANMDFVNGFLQNVSKDPYDIRILENPNVHVSSVNAVITNFYDRNRHSYGTGNIWEMGNANFSDREVAQSKKVLDEQGNELDWTPNDKGGLFKGLFRPALYMDCYEEDGYHEENGRQVYHRKGELRLDENGDPRARILGKNDSYGKDMIHYSDTITMEGSTWNRWDPFDSDGLTKSIGGTVMKTALSIAPYFIPYVGPWLGGIAALGGIASFVPVLGKTMDSFITGTDDNSFGRSMTSIENWFGKFGSSQSDEARGRFFSLENIGDMIVSSAGQLYSQRIIGEAPVKISQLMNGNKDLRRLGRTLSLGYMAATSSADTYGAFKQAGASDWLSSVGMLTTMGCFYGLMNTGYFKDKLFEGSLLDEEQNIRRNITEIVREEAQKIFGDDFYKITFKPGTWMDTLAKSDSRFGQWIARSNKATREFFKRLPIGRAGGVENAFFSRAINEGVEEWMEEIMQDSVKGLAKGLEAFGFKVTDPEADTLDFGIEPGEMMQRWATSFVGGAIGGTTFEALNQWEFVKNPEMRKFYNMPAFKRMAYDLQDSENLERYRNTIKRMGNRGQFASKYLSATEFDITKKVKDDEKGANKRVYKQTSNAGESQNAAMQSFLNQTVNTMYNILNDEGLVKSNRNLLFEALSNPNIKKKAEEQGLTIGEYFEQNGRDAIMDTLMDMGMFTPIFLQAREIGTKIFSLEMDLRSMRDSILKDTDAKTKSERDEVLKNNTQYQFLLQQKNKLKEQYNTIVSGKNSDDYMGFALMRLVDSPLKYYVDLYNATDENGKTVKIGTLDLYAKTNFGVDMSTLKDEGVRQYITDEYNKFQEVNGRLFWRIWEFHKKLNEGQFKTDLENAEKKLKDAKLNKFRGGITVGEYTESLKSRLEKFNEKLSSSETTDEEKGELIGAVGNTEALISFYSTYAPDKQLSQIFNLEGLNEEFSDNLFKQSVTFSNDAEVQAAKANVRQYYQYIKDNKIVNNHNLDYLYEFLQRLGLEPDINHALYIIHSLPNVGILKESLKEQYPEMDVPERYGDFIYLDQLEEIIDFNIDKYPDLDPDIICSSNTDFNGLNKLEDTEYIKNLFTLFKVNPKKAIAEYNKFVESFKDVNFEKLSKYIEADPQLKGISIHSAKELVDTILFQGDSEFVSFVQEILDLAESDVQSPIYEILQNLSVTLNGQRNQIIDILSNERKKLEAVDTTEEYQLGTAQKQALDEAQMLLNILAASIDGAQSNFNEELNKYRNGNSKSEFAIISENTANILAQDIEHIQSQINYLNVLGGNNLSKRMVQQQTIMKLDTIKRIKYFVEPPEEDKVVLVELNSLFGSENYLKDLWEQVKKDLNFDVDFENINIDTNFAEFDKARREFESRLYQEFSKLTESDKSTKIGRISEIFSASTANDQSFLSSDAGELTDNEGSTVTRYGMYRYLLINLLTDSKEVLSYYKTAMKNSKYVPFYTQELIIRDIWANYYNTALYDKGLSILGEKYKSSKSPFLENCEIIKGFLFVNGVPGAGKTEVIAKTIKEMITLRDGTNTEFVAISIKDAQAKKLANSLGLEGGYTLEEIVTKSKKTDGNVTYNSNSAHQVLDENYEVNSDKSIISKQDRKNIFITFDEIGLAQEADLKKFFKYIDTLRAANPNSKIFVLGLGDLNQATSSIEDPKNKSNDIEVSLTNFGFASSFRLTASFRETNQGKADNLLAIFNILKTAQDKFYKNKEYDISSANNEIISTLNSRNVSFKWYETSDAIYGDKAIDDSKTKPIVEKLLSKIGDSKSDSPQIAIIVDESSKQNWQGLYGNDSRVIVYTKDEAQGGEFDYVICDASLNNNAYLGLKEMYTMMSRARNATFFTPKSIIAGVDFDTTPNPNAAVLLKSENDETQQKIYDAYRTWRMDLISDIEEIENVSSEKSPSQVVDDTIGSMPTPPAVDASKVGDDFETEETINELAAVSEPMTKLDQKLESERKTAANDKNAADDDVFVEWLNSTDITTLPGSLLSSKVDINQKENYKDFIRYVGVFFLEGRNNTKNIRDEFDKSVGTRWDSDNIRKLIAAIKQKFIDNSDIKLYASKLPQDDTKSLISLGFTVDSVEIAIPITIVNGQHVGQSSFKPTDQLFSKKVDFVVYSSKGQNKIKLNDVIKRKVSKSPLEAAFVDRGSSKNIAQDAEKFGKQHKVYSILNTLSWEFESNADTSEASSVRKYLTPEKDNGGAITYWVDKSSSNRLVGTQLRVTVDECLNTIQLASTARDGNRVSDETRNAARKELEEKYGVIISSKPGEQSWNVLSGNPRAYVISSFVNVSQDSSIIDNGTPIYKKGSDFVLRVALERNNSNESGTYYIVFSTNGGEITGDKTCTITDYEGHPIGTDDGKFSITINAENLTYKNFISTILNGFKEKFLSDPAFNALSAYKDSIDFNNIGTDLFVDFYQTSSNAKYKYYPIPIWDFIDLLKDKSIAITADLNKHGRKYLDLSTPVDVYFNSENGANDASWGVISDIQKRSRFSTDVSKVVAPLYQFELPKDDKNNERSFTGENPFLIKKETSTTLSAINESRSATYKRNETSEKIEFIFANAQLDGNWLINAQINNTLSESERQSLINSDVELVSIVKSMNDDFYRCYIKKNGMTITLNISSDAVEDILASPNLNKISSDKIVSKVGSSGKNLILRSNGENKISLGYLSNNAFVELNKDSILGVYRDSKNNIILYYKSGNNEETFELLDNYKEDIKKEIADIWDYDYLGEFNGSQYYSNSDWVYTRSANGKFDKTTDIPTGLRQSNASDAIYKDKLLEVLDETNLAGKVDSNTLSFISNYINYAKNQIKSDTWSYQDAIDYLNTYFKNNKYIFENGYYLQISFVNGEPTISQSFDQQVLVYSQLITKKDVGNLLPKITSDMNARDIESICTQLNSAIEISPDSSREFIKFFVSLQNGQEINGEVIQQNGVWSASINDDIINLKNKVISELNTLFENSKNKNNKTVAKNILDYFSIDRSKRSSEDDDRFLENYEKLVDIDKELSDKVFALYDKC